MKRDCNSKRSKNFILRHSLNYSDAEEFVRMLLDIKYQISQEFWEIKKYQDDIIALFVTNKKNNNVIVCYIDSFYVELKLVLLNSNNEKIILRQFVHDNCWTNAIKCLQEFIKYGEIKNKKIY